MTPANAAAKVDADRRRSDAPGARVIPVPPPLYFGGAFAAGMALNVASSGLRFGTGPALLVVGSGVVAAGAGFVVAGIAQVRKARTTIVPHRPVTALLTSGAFRFSRNPMYTGLAVAYLGGVVLAGSCWPLLTWPLALLAVRVLVIGPEERYLDTRFGDAYRDYSSHTHRWIGLTAPGGRRSCTDAGERGTRTSAVNQGRHMRVTTTADRVAHPASVRGASQSLRETR